MAPGSRTDEAATPPEPTEAPAGPDPSPAAAVGVDPSADAAEPAPAAEPGPTIEGPEPAGDQDGTDPDPAANEANEANEADLEADADPGADGDGAADPDAEAGADSAAAPQAGPDPENGPVAVGLDVTWTTDVAPLPPRESPLVVSLHKVRAELGSVRFPLEVPGAGAAARSARMLATQLDDYLLPRLSRLDAPMLVVVGGSTGAGKSTLINSLVRAPVSPAGVLRPTTRAPVLVSAPGDTRWFLGTEPGSALAEQSDPHLLPGLTRTTGLRAEPGMLRVISAPGLPRGLALLDAPDLDSVVAANRALADEVHRAADLWLCVTTATRYADAVPWASLRAARDRGTRLALLLNRVPPGAEAEIIEHLGELLDAEGLSGTRLFVLPEVALDGQGLLAEPLVAPIGDWLAELAGDPATRVRVIGDTLGGALAALRWAVAELADAAEQQDAVATALHEQVRRTYGTALAVVEDSLASGTLLRGQALIPWHRFVDEGGLHAALKAAGGRIGRRARSVFAGADAPGSRLLAALSAALVTLITEAVAEAGEEVRAAWSADPAGAALLAEAQHGGSHAAPATPNVVQTAQARADRVRALVRDWRVGVADAAGDETLTLLVVLRVLAGELPLEPREEVRIRGILGQQSVRTLVDNARTDLQERVRQILDAEAATFTALLAGTDDAGPAAQRLRAAVSPGAPE